MILKNIKFHPRVYLIVVTALAISNSALGQAQPRLGKAPVKLIVAAMTLHEKASLVTGFQGTVIVTGNNRPSPERLPGAAGETYAIPRLGIPSIIFADGSSGLRIRPVRNNDSSKTFYTTQFPSGTLLASTWDTAMVKSVGAAIANEAHSYGADILLAPAINIQRNPLGGRNYEYYSEDPFLTGTLASSMIKGIQSAQVGASLKHFAVNNQENNRKNIDAVVSERALREIYLRGFETAIKAARPWTVMSSYNKINGTYTSESTGLLQNILRNEWHFDGFVLTDWYSGSSPAAQLSAGNDLLMPGSSTQAKDIEDAVNNHQLDINMLNREAANILNIILRTPQFKKYKFNNSPDLKAHARIAREAAGGGAVLLKNMNNALPVQPNRKIAMFGISGYSFTFDATTSVKGPNAYRGSLIQGLVDAGFRYDEQLAGIYKNYLSATRADNLKLSAPGAIAVPPSEISITEPQIKKAASEDDVAVISIGRTSNKGTDRRENFDFNLTTEEKKLVANIGKEFHDNGKKVIILLNITGPIETASWRDLADGILLAWQPGTGGGSAIADILSGKTNPSGKLTVTFPAAYADVPSARSFPGINQAVYDEGIYVGYRYYNTFEKPVAYEFGFGLSYTDFSYSQLKLSDKTFHGNIKISLTVKNTGQTAGRDVVQLYLHAPAADIDKPESELKSFCKTNLLLPGQTQVISFTLKSNALASYKTNRAAWVADAGTYTVKVGSSALKISQTASFNLDKELITEKVSNQLTPIQSIEELKRMVK